MATSFTYVYDIETDIKKEDLVQILKSSHEVFIKDGDGGITYIYDDASSMFYPLRFTEHIKNLDLLRHLSIDEICSLISTKIRVLCFRRHKLDYKGVYLRSLEKNIDYAQTITDLEKIGCITIIPSTNYLASDDRKFSFVDDPLVAYEVDCLGTSLCQDITDRVVDAWKQYQPEESL